MDDTNQAGVGPAEATPTGTEANEPAVVNSQPVPVGAGEDDASSAMIPVGDNNPMAALESFMAELVNAPTPPPAPAPETAPAEPEPVSAEDEEEPHKSDKRRLQVVDDVDDAVLDRHREARKSGNPITLIEAARQVEAEKAAKAAATAPPAPKVETTPPPQVSEIDSKIESLRAARKDAADIADFEEADKFDSEIRALQDQRADALVSHRETLARQTAEAEAKWDREWDKADATAKQLFDGLDDATSALYQEVKRLSDEAVAKGETITPDFPLLVAAKAQANLKAQGKARPNAAKSDRAPAASSPVPSVAPTQFSGSQGTQSTGGGDFLDQLARLPEAQRSAALLSMFDNLPIV